MNVASYQWLLIVVIYIIYSVDANWITGNLCWSMPCMNGGSCFGSSYTYLCVCPVNYSGALCEKRLGICQESPCGNRGLCVETGLTSFECRCYFDYMGPLCEEHVPKNDASVWSSLIPVHTRVLFDILQEAYRVKAHGKSAPVSHNGQINFPGLLKPNDRPSLSLSTTTTTTTSTKTTTLKTTKKEHVIRAQDIQLENIFPEISTVTKSDISTQSFTTETQLQTTEQNQYNDETTLVNNTTSLETTEDLSTTLLPSTMIEDIITVSIEQNQTNYLNITEDQQVINTTEQFDTTITSFPIELSSYNDVDDDNTTEIIQNSTEQINTTTTTTTEEFLTSTPFPTTDYTLFETNNYSSLDQTDFNELTSSEETITSTLISTDTSFTTEKIIDTMRVSQDTHSQLLLKLCQQLLSHILPNVSSLSSSAAIEAALSLSADSSSSGNNSAEELLAWIKEQLSTPPTTTITTTTTTTTTTVSQTPSSSSSSSSLLLINKKKSSSISLQRVDMDDIFHQMNNNIDGEK